MKFWIQLIFLRLTRLHWCRIGVGFFCTFFSTSFAQYKYFSVSVNGSYSQSKTEYSDKLRTSYGAELGIPLTSFLEVSYNYSRTDDKDKLNQKYRDELTNKGIAVPADTPLTRKVTLLDQSLDAGVGFMLGFIKPTFFGGFLWRTSCFEEWYADFGCSQATKPTWNAGAMITTYITQRLRFKVTYRMSPVTNEGAPSKVYDRSVSLGLSWGY
jgi:hypothetical protein